MSRSSTLPRKCKHVAGVFRGHRSFVGCLQRNRRYAIKQEPIKSMMASLRPDNYNKTLQGPTSFLSSSSYSFFRLLVFLLSLSLQPHSIIHCLFLLLSLLLSFRIFSVSCPFLFVLLFLLRIFSSRVLCFLDISHLHFSSCCVLPLFHPHFVCLFKFFTMIFLLFFLPLLFVGYS